MTSTTSHDDFARRYFSGERVHGDDFSLAQIEEWYRQEETGYYDLKKRDGLYAYGYHALNRRHGFSALGDRIFDCCVALGCARGDDVAPLAPQVRRFIAIEPAEQWWSDAISVTPASFIKPAISGDIALADGAADLATCLGVLHHIPNAGHVLAEIARVLRPGGVFLMVDIKASSQVEDNVGVPFATYLYTVSTMHCMTVSLAQGGAGLGTCWGRELAEKMLQDAGLRDITVEKLPHDDMNYYYIAKKPQ
jgi:SAM-dependent methyltransferase